MDRKRIAVFTTEDYVWSFRVCADAVPELAKKYEVVGIYHFPEKLGHRRGYQIPLWYLRVFGLFNFILFGLFGLRRRAMNFLGPVKTWEGLAGKYHLQLEKGDTPNSESVCEWVKQNQIDVILIMLNDILKQEILTAPRIGVLNKHAGLLPACRGAYPFFWSKLNQHPTGVSYHAVDNGIDTGGVLLQMRYPPNGQKQGLSMLRFYEDIFHLFPTMASEAIERLIEGRYTDFPVAASSYYGFPCKEDFKRFLKKGYRVARISDLFYRPSVRAEGLIR